MSKLHVVTWVAALPLGKYMVKIKEHCHLAFLNSSLSSNESYPSDS